MIPIPVIEGEADYLTEALDLLPADPWDGETWGAEQRISVGEALIRLRAFAFSNDLPIAEVARDVIARKLRLRMPPAITI